MKNLKYLKKFEKFNENHNQNNDYMMFENHKARVYTFPSNYHGEDYKRINNSEIYKDTPKEFDYIFRIVYLDDIDERYNIQDYYIKELDFFRQADETDYASENETIYLPIDEKREKTAIEENDQDYFYDENNFKETTPKKEMLESEEYIEYYTGTNWEIDIITDNPVMEIDNRFDGTIMEEIYSDKNGQGQGHEEFYEIKDSNNKHLMYAHRPVSYWQGDRNDLFYWTNSEYIKKLIK